ncbi:UDP-N-acetylmuramate dehydrogenase [soil metagenome]
MRYLRLVILADHTTLRLGGPARRSVVATTDVELVAAVTDSDTRGEPVLVLGGGSNLFASDDGFDGVVVAVRTRGIGVTERASSVALEVSAGEDWDALVAHAVTRNLAGIEALSGIPGLVGATPIQNVGAYGQEVKDTIESVRVWDRHERATLTLDAAACDFRYRESRLKDEPGRYIVLRATFVLAKSVQSAPIRYAELARALSVRENDRAPLGLVRETVIALRRTKGMVVDPNDPDSTSAGSFFMNPIVDRAALAAVEERVRARLGDSVQIPRFPAASGRIKLPAAWLIERAGFAKGRGEGRVGISAKHTLALVNRGGGTTAELLELAREVRAGVESAFGIRLTAEPVLVGCAL